MALHLFSDYDMRPSQLLDQHFGMGLYPDDINSPWAFSRPHFHPMLSSRSFLPAYYRPWRAAGAAKDYGSTIVFDKDKFQVNLDVQQFRPEELSVKVVNGSVVIEGKHEEKEDEHGFVSRHFQRRYVVPQGHDTLQIVSKLSSDGVLSITAPRIAPQENNEREIPILATGEPHRMITAGKEQKILPPEEQVPPADK